MTTRPCKVIHITSAMTEEQWLTARRAGIGGSEVGAILGISPWASPYSVWADKTGVAPSTFTGNEATDLGKELERPVANLYAKRTNRSVAAIPVMLQSIEHPHMIANVDFFIVKTSERYPAGVVTDVPVHVAGQDPYELIADDIEAILEIKTGGLVGRTSKAWDDNSIPDTYRAQGMHYAAVTGVRNVVYCALLGGQGLTIREMYVADDTIASLIQDEAVFWDSVIHNIAPEPLGLDVDFEIIRDRYAEPEPGATVEADDFLAETVESYKAAQQEMNQAEAQLKRLRAQLELAIGNAESVVYEGRTLFTYKANKSTETIDTKALIADNPELAEAYRTKRPGARVLRMSK